MDTVDRIKELAKKRGWSLQKVAEKAEIGINSIYRWNSKTPSTQSLIKVAKVLDVSTDYLLNGDAEESNKTADLADEETIFTYEGKKIPPEDLEYMKRILRGGKAQVINMNTEDMVWDLLHLAMDHDIDVQWAGVLSKYTPPACRIDTKIVCMDSNWHRPKEIPFQLAHELAHIICGAPEDICFYNSSFTGKSSVEYKANVGAVKFLVPYYCAETEKENVNVYDFEKQYLIPEYLNNVVSETVKKYY